MPKLRKLSLYGIFFLALTAFSLWHYIYSHKPSNKAFSSVLYAGKGEAAYVRAPDGAQLIIGSAPSGALLKPLQKIEPANNKEIDVLVITGTVAIDYGGFVDLLKTYHVGAVVMPAFSSKAKTYAELQSLIREKHIPEVSIHGSTEIILDNRHGISYKISCPMPVKVSSKYACWSTLGVDQPQNP